MIFFLTPTGDDNFIKCLGGKVINIFFAFLFYF